MYTEIKADLEQDENLDGCACLILDGGVIYEGVSEKSVEFTIDIDGKKLPDSVVNHRYPNKIYHTFTKKYGKRRSTIGYPILFGFDKNGRVSKTIQMDIHIEIEGRSINISVPIKLNMSRENPVCGLEFHIFYKGLIRFFSYEHDTGLGGWNRKECNEYIHGRWNTTGACVCG